MSPAAKTSSSKKSSIPSNKSAQASAAVQPLAEQAVPAVQPAPITQAAMANGKTNVIAILSLIFAFLFPLAGFILAIIALVQLHKHPEEKGKGLAIAGLVISIVLFLLFILLIFIGMIAYFGVLNPDTMMPSSCVMPGGFSCVEFRTNADGNTILGIQNNLGVDLSSVSLSLISDCSPQNVPLPNGQIQNFNCKTQPGNIGDRLNSDISVKYTKQGSDFVQSETGSLFSRYE
jgi:hypothetical protein